MRCLVTGGAGFIGTNLVYALKQERYEVVVVDNLSNGNRENLPKGVDFYDIDIRDEKLIDIFYDFKPEVVFHLAAHIDVRNSMEDPEFDLMVNAEGTINIINCMIKAKTKKIIYSSTGGALYGNRRGSTEDIIPFPLSPYGVSKLAGEHYIRIYSEWYGFEFTILRYANVYGPFQNPFGEAGVVAIFIKNLLNGETPVLYGYGKMRRDYVFVKDVVRANLLSIEGGNGETLNIGTGLDTSVTELYNLIQETAGIHIEPKLKEARPGELEVSSLNSRRAEIVLGWKPEYTLKEGLKETWNWFKTHR